MNAYEGLDEDEDTRWAYGTGFTAALASVDHAVPSGVDTADLATYCLMLADDALILSHRLSEWASWAPELEEDVALANIALDLLGQARLLLTRAAEVCTVRPSAAPAHIPDEDALAYFRVEHEFRNVRLSEVDCGPGPGGDFATTIARLLLLSTWRLAVFSRLVASADPVIAAVAVKGVKELAYHRDHAAQWTVRLGQGTTESAARMRAGLDAVWPLLGELFADSATEQRLPGVAVLASSVRDEVCAVLAQVLRAAGLAEPTVGFRSGVHGHAGRDGVHTEQLGYLLAEMQYLARSMPDAVW